MTRRAEVRRYTTVKYTTPKGKVFTYEIPERFMGYALLGPRFGGDVLAFMAWWHDQSQMEKAFKRQQRKARRAA